MITSNLDTQTLVKHVLAHQVSESRVTDVVLNQMMAKYDFGQGLFHKILNRSILKPGSLEAENN